MRLKTIEIKGFKSFAEKTLLHFDQNVTGIVGPNGCGKSNVVDAIRWVLGETKSRALRSDKQENLIFNGTSNTKAAAKAQVSLTFENTKNLLPTEFSTVTISRAYYRNGDSEYRINDVKCRLKDIADLFMDTGISSDSYAIIELQMISQILNDKENLRRRLFEQAAGISKYKTRKKETLNKLALTETDLNRVEDLLAEIEGNLKNLEKQAKRAEKYNKLKEQHKDLSVQLTLHQLTEHKVVYEELTGKQTEQQNAKLQIETTLNQLEADIAKGKTDLIAQEQQLAAAQRKLDEHVDVLRKKENNKGILTERIKFLREKKENLQNRIREDRIHLETLRKDVLSIKDEIEAELKLLNKITGQLEELQATRKQAQEEFDAQKGVLEQEQGSLRGFETELASLEKEAAIFNTQQEGLKQELGENKLKFKTRSEDLKQLHERKDKGEKEKARLEEKLAQLSAQEKSSQENIDGLSARIETENQELIHLQNQFGIQQKEYQITKEMLENMEGYPESIKYLKNQAKWMARPMLLSDIIDCEDASKASIQYYLEPWLNHYVVPKLSDAITAINLLEENKKGKANFLVLDELPAKGKVETPPYVGKAAASLVKVDQKYEDLIDYLFNNVYIIPPEHMLEVNRKHPALTLITADGKMVKQQEKLSGGVAGSFGSKRLGRVQQLKEMQEALSALNLKLEQQKKQLSDSKSELEQAKKQQKSNEIQAVKNELNLVENQLISCNTNIDNFELFLEDNESRESNLQNAIDEIGTKIGALQVRIGEAAGVKNEKLSQLEKVKGKYQELEIALNKVNQEFNNFNIEYHKQQNKLNSTRQNADYKQNRIYEIENQNIDAGNELKHAEEELETIEADIKNSDSGLKDLYIEKESLEAAVQGVEKEYFSVRGSIEEQEKTLRQTEKNRTQADTLLNEIKDKFNELQMKLLSVKERMSIQFQIDIEELLQQDPEEGYEINDLEEKVERIQKRLNNFGEVNPFAVEAYNEMKERFDFINGQKEDLMQAKDSLIETIEEIEKTATEKFLDAFDKVRTNFKEVFQKLFRPGDKCDIKLSNPDLPLESKVDIIARPKGKRPLTIDQLSGGEKSLTAISLIFSLYLLKPAPFCILDEVDAPLDDDNVDKFNAMIREFSENSQFIVVTHNKNTMAEVDIIYGVVMAKTGVSKAVPVDFNNLSAGAVPESALK